MRYPVLVLLALALAGCGATVSQPLVPAASNGQFTATESPAHVRAGGVVHVTLTVVGPARFESGCLQTFRIWATDGHNQRVWEQPRPPMMCFAIARTVLPAGETATFKADWPTAPTLAPGIYQIHGLCLQVLPDGADSRASENMPVLSMSVT